MHFKTQQDKPRRFLSKCLALVVLMCSILALLAACSNQNADDGCIA